MPRRLASLYSKPSLAVVLLPLLLGAPATVEAGERIAVAGTQVTIEALPSLKPTGNGMLVDPGKLIVIISDLPAEAVDAEIANMQDPAAQASIGLREVVASSVGSGDKLRWSASSFGIEGNGDFRKHFLLVRDGGKAAMVIVAMPRAVYDADPASDSAVSTMFASVALGDAVAAAPRFFAVTVPPGYAQFPPGVAGGQFQTYMSVSGSSQIVAAQLDKDNDPAKVKSIGFKSIEGSLARQILNAQILARTEGTSGEWAFVEVVAAGQDANLATPARVVARVQSGPQGSYLVIGVAPESEADAQFPGFRSVFDTIVAVP